MRVTTILIAALAASPGAALAQQSGEVALQVSAVGVVHRPADEVGETIMISASGDTAEAARAALDGKVVALKAALARIGVPASAMSVSNNATTAGPIVMPPVIAAIPNPQPAATSTQPVRHPAHGTATLTLTSKPALSAQIDETVAAQGASVTGRPRYSLKDDKDARIAAAADALAAARANAERYAATLKMRIVRMTRVSDYSQSLDLSQVSDLASSFDPMQRGGADVTVRVRIWMDFAMAPL